MSEYVYRVMTRMGGGAWTPFSGATPKNTYRTVGYARSVVTHFRCEQDERLKLAERFGTRAIIPLREFRVERAPLGKWEVVPDVQE